MIIFKERYTSFQFPTAKTLDFDSNWYQFVKKVHFCTQRVPLKFGLISFHYLNKCTLIEHLRKLSSEEICKLMQFVLLAQK